MPQGTVEVFVQTDFVGNAPANFCMSQEASEVAIQTNPVMTQDDETQIEETHHYIRLGREAIIIKLYNELTKTHQELSQHKEEVVPLQVHQELQKKFKELTVTEDETFANFKDEQNKLEKAQAKLQKAKEQIETICSLQSDALSCRSPTTNYALFLL